MAQQGILPVYDTTTKKILGYYLLPYQKTFVGNETTHNVNFPAAGNASNTVPVQKIEPVQMDINGSRRQQNDFMAAVFTREQVRLGHYKCYPNFVDINAVVPKVTWTASEMAARGIENWGLVIKGLEVSFKTAATDEADYVP
jgi:hypothetical protein